MSPNDLPGQTPAAPPQGMSVEQAVGHCYSYLQEARTVILDRVKVIALLNEREAAARADERVKVLDKMMDRIIPLAGPGTRKWNWYYDLAKSLKVPEAQPVEPSEGEGT